MAMRRPLFRDTIRVACTTSALLALSSAVIAQIPPQQPAYPQGGYAPDMTSQMAPPMMQQPQQSHPIRALFAGTIAAVIQGTGAGLAAGLAQGVTGALANWFNKGNRPGQVAQYGAMPQTYPQTYPSPGTMTTDPYAAANAAAGYPATANTYPSPATAYPTNPSTTYPATASNTYPATPTSPYPATASTAYPTTPSATYPTNSPGTYPTTPGATYPANPAGPSPTQPSAAYPATPATTYPSASPGYPSTSQSPGTYPGAGPANPTPGYPTSVPNAPMPGPTQQSPNGAYAATGAYPTTTPDPYAAQNPNAAAMPVGYTPPPQVYDAHTGQMTSAVGTVYAMPAAAATGQVYAGVAYEVHAVGPNGSSMPINPATYVFRTGDRFVVYYRPSLPGRMDVYNVNPSGQQTRIESVDMAAGQLATLGPYEFSAATGDESLRIVLAPCSTPQLLVATRDIVNVSGSAAPTAGVSLGNCGAPTPRGVKVNTRDIKKVALDGNTSFALDPVSHQELASGQVTAREVSIVFHHR
jgi:hypothetical protein